MPAIPRKQHVSWKDRFQVLRGRLKSSIHHRLSRNILVFIFLSSLLVSGSWSLMTKPGRIVVNGANVNCIKENVILEKMNNLSWWQIGRGDIQNRLSKDYACIQSIHISWQPFSTCVVDVKTKPPLVAILSQSVEFRDDVGWYESFQLPRKDNELWYLSEDASVSEFSQDSALPRITFLRQDETRRVSQQELQYLWRMMQLFQKMDAAYPKIEFMSEGLVRVSSLQFSELYLPLDDTWEMQLQKAIAVAGYLKLRGERFDVIDAHNRDVTVVRR